MSDLNSQTNAGNINPAGPTPMPGADLTSADPNGTAAQMPEPTTASGVESADPIVPTTEADTAAPSNASGPSIAEEPAPPTINTESTDATTMGSEAPSSNPVQQSSVNMELGASDVDTASVEPAPATEPVNSTSQNEQSNPVQQEELNVPPEIAVARQNLQAEANAQSTAMAPKKKLSTTTIIIIAAAVLLVLVGGYFVYSRFASKGDSSSDEYFTTGN